MPAPAVICMRLRAFMHTRLSTPLRPLALSHIAKRTHSFILLEPLLNNMSLPKESAVREECWIDTASVPRCTKHMLYRTVSYWVVLHCLVPQWYTGKIGKAFECNYRWRQCNFKTECRILVITYLNLLSLKFVACPGQHSTLVPYDIFLTCQTFQTWFCRLSILLPVFCDSSASKIYWKASRRAFSTHCSRFEMTGSWPHSRREKSLFSGLLCVA